MLAKTMTDTMLRYRVVSQSCFYLTNISMRDTADEMSLTSSDVV